MRRTFAAVALVVAWSAHAQTPGVEFEKVLVPLALSRSVLGAYGSLWSTTLWVLNAGDTDARVEGYHHCVTIPCPLYPPPVPPGIAFMPQFPIGIGLVRGVPGAFLLIERARSAQVKLSLRVQDLSRQRQTWGTELPIVREHDFRSDAIHLLDIPVSAHARSMLRVYDNDGRAGLQVRVRFYSLEGDSEPLSTRARPGRLLGETILPLGTIEELEPSRLGGHYPAYAQLGDFAAVANLEGAERIRIEVTPVTPARIWAFVSVTNNETQHVTAITPN